eukprot:2225059-Amphidinium_carterae.1
MVVTDGPDFEMVLEAQHSTLLQNSPNHPREPLPKEQFFKIAYPESGFRGPLAVAFARDHACANALLSPKAAQHFIVWAAGVRQLSLIRLPGSIVRGCARLQWMSLCSCTRLVTSEILTCKHSSFESQSVNPAHVHAFK